MLTEDQAAIVKGMLERGDKQQDIAARFGINSGRIADIKSGRKHIRVMPAPLNALPPPGPPVAMLAMTAATITATDLDLLIKTTPRDHPTVVLDITPEIAQQILEERNSNNRNKRPAKIKRFSADMSAGLWTVTGDTIKFGDTGELQDGQNRLRACLNSGVPFRTHVAFGIDPAAFKVLDSGAGRNGTDTFVVAGVRSAEVVSRAVRWLMIFENPRIDRGLSVPNATLFEYHQQRVNKDMLQEAIRLAKLVRRTLPTGSLAAMFYLFARKDPAMAKIFAQDLEKGLRSAKHLLAKIDHLRTQTGSRVNERLITALTVQCWNSYRAGTPINSKSALKWTDDMPHPTIA
jgi:hypothetical protein